MSPFFAKNGALNGPIYSKNEMDTLLRILGAFCFDRTRDSRDGFFGFGQPTPEERSLMVKGFIVEIAACVIALFYSMFGLRKSGESELEDNHYAELKNELELLKAQVAGLNDPLQGIKSGQTHTAPGEEWFLRDRWEDRIANSDFQTTISATEYSIKPLPKEISDDIDAARPYEREARRSTYVGLKVLWKVTFELLFTEETDRTFLVYCRYSDLGRIKFVVKIDDYPRFKHLEKDSLLWVAGTISDFDSIVMHLSDVIIEFEK